MIKRAYAAFCKFELWVVAFMLITITGLVFAAAMCRTFGYPINWAGDISMLLFAWTVFIGGDIIVREGNLISVDMFNNMLPVTVRKILKIVFCIMIVVFLAYLVRYGFQLLIVNRRRMFLSTNLSYSWCTLSVPVGAFLMIISICIRTVREFLGIKQERQGGEIAL